VFIWKFWPGAACVLLFWFGRDTTRAMDIRLRAAIPALISDGKAFVLASMKVVDDGVVVGARFLPLTRRRGLGPAGVTTGAVTVDCGKVGFTPLISVCREAQRALAASGRVPAGYFELLRLCERDGVDSGELRELTVPLDRARALLALDAAAPSPSAETAHPELPRMAGETDEHADAHTSWCVGLPEVGRLALGNVERSFLETQRRKLKLIALLWGLHAASGVALMTGPVLLLLGIVHEPLVLGASLLGLVFWVPWAPSPYWCLQTSRLVRRVQTDLDQGDGLRFSGESDTSTTMLDPGYLGLVQAGVLVPAAGATHEIVVGPKSRLLRANAPGARCIAAAWLARSTASRLHSQTPVAVTG
jgi:hypothetical protein